MTFLLIPVVLALLTIPLAYAEYRWALAEYEAQFKQPITPEA